jgi:serine/threonine protein kinase
VHNAGVVHNDLHLHNFFMDDPLDLDHLSVYLGDFGLADSVANPFLTPEAKFVCSS